MIIVVDGYNVLKQVERANEVDPLRRDHFIKRLARYGKKKGHTLIIVFDGGPDRRATRECIHGATIVYAGAGASADDYIKRYITQQAGRDLLLVSSDRELVQHAHARGKTALGSLDFYQLAMQTLTASKNEDNGSGILTQEMEHDPELDQLMRQAAVTSMYKQEERESLAPQVEKRKLTKEERKILEKIKKL